VAVAFLAILARGNFQRGPRKGADIVKKERQREAQVDENEIGRILVEGKIIAELKSVEAVSKAHKKQILTYLKLSHLKLGLLLNFGAAIMKDGVTRTVNALDESR
jgi:GxxExxY protein